MNYHNITVDDMNNGSGLRVVLWLSGCNHYCKGCQNPQTWDANSGIKFDKEAENELFDAIDHDYISGLTLSGGDPLYVGNREDVQKLLVRFRKHFKDKKNVWLYTGYKWEDIKDLETVKMCDVVVDGEFDINKADVNYPWAGSTNQRVFNVHEELSNDQ